MPWFPTINFALKTGLPGRLQVVSRYKRENKTWRCTSQTNFLKSETYNIDISQKGDKLQKQKHVYTHQKTCYMHVVITFKLPFGWSSGLWCWEWMNTVETGEGVFRLSSSSTLCSSLLPLLHNNTCKVINKHTPAQAPSNAQILLGSIFPRCVRNMLLP